MKTLLMAVVAGVLMLGGCGQRGPLYLPDQPPPKKRLSQLEAPRTVPTSRILIPS